MASGSFNWQGYFAVVLVAATLSTVPLSLGVIALYRRSIKREMARSAGRHLLARATAPAEVVPSPSEPLRRQVISDAAPPPVPGLAAQAVRTAMTAPWLGVLPYVAGGLVHAALQAFILLHLWGVDFLPGRFLVLTFTNAWPLVPTIALACLASWRKRAALAAAYALAYAGLSLAFDSPDLWGLWVSSMAVPSAVFLLVTNRRLRPAGPPLLVFTSVAAAGAVALPNAFAVTLRLAPDALTVVGPLLAGAVLLAAWLALRNVARRYERKRSSDDSVAIDVYWLLVTEWQCLLAASGAGWAALVALAPYAAYWLVTKRAQRRVLAAARRRGNSGLLLLRVFAPGPRAERLMTDLGLHWRHLGSIQLIAAPDLAAQNLEPHELFDFLQARLGERFVKDEADLERKLAALDLEPDPDGRHRVNEFFCHADTWRLALDRLAPASRVVLMDLRGFGAANEGCRYEIGQLLQRVPLARVVLLVDGTTEADVLDEVLGDAWSRTSAASPNRMATPPPALTVVSIDRRSSPDTRALLSVLCAAAS